MAGRRRVRPPTTKEVIPASPDESVRMNSLGKEQADGEQTEFEESEGVYTDDFEDSTTDEFVEEEVDEEIEENSEEERRMLQNNNDNPSIRDGGGIENITLDPSYNTVADRGEEDEEENQGEGEKQGEEEKQEAMRHHYSCQATLVRPGVSDERLIQCGMLQRNELNKCKILIFLSRATGFQCKCMTVEVVESPNVSSRVRSRRNKGFHEIKQSRSPDIDVLRDERIRISFSGNIQRIDKREIKNLTFQFSATSEENCVETKIKRVGCVTGVRYGIVTIKIGSDKHHEVHFYVDYPLDNTTNLNKKTQSLESDHINPNAQIQNSKGGLNVRSDSNSPTLQTDSAGETSACDGHRCDITDKDDAAVTTQHVTAALVAHTSAPVINPCHSGVSAEQGGSLHSVSLTPSSSDERRETIHCESLTVSDEYTDLVFTEDVIMSLMANNRGDANGRTGPIASSSHVRAPFKQNAEGTPALVLPDICMPRPSVTQRVTPGRQTIPHFGNNVFGEASDRKQVRYSSSKWKREHVYTKHNPGIQRAHDTPRTIFPPLSVKEPRGLSSLEIHANQLLRESSLQALSHALDIGEWQQVMVDFEMGACNITRIVERAVKENWDPRFKLLMAWHPY